MALIKAITKPSREKAINVTAQPQLLLGKLGFELEDRPVAQARHHDFGLPGVMVDAHPQARLIPATLSAIDEAVSQVQFAGKAKALAHRHVYIERTGSR